MFASVCNFGQLSGHEPARTISKLIGTSTKFL
jgi:hypothetical protein